MRRRATGHLRALVAAIESRTAVARKVEGAMNLLVKAQPDGRDDRDE